MIKLFIAAIAAWLPVMYLLAMNVHPAALAVTLSVVAGGGMGYLAGRLAALDRDAARVGTAYHTTVRRLSRRISRGQ